MLHEATEWFLLRFAAKSPSQRRLRGSLRENERRLFRRPRTQALAALCLGVWFVSPAAPAPANARPYEGPPPAGRTAQPSDAAKSVDELVGDLKASDPAARFQAVAALRRLGPAAGAAAERLTTLLGDKAVVRIPAPPRLRIPYYEIRMAEAAEAALVAIGRAAVPALTAVLKTDPDHHVREHAARALERINAPMDEVWAAAVGDRAVAVRLIAVRQLGKSRGPVALGALTKALRDPEFRVRAAAVEGLGAIGGKDAVAPLLTALKDDSVAHYAAPRLGYIGAPAVPSIIAAIEDPAFKNGDRAASALRFVSDPKARRVLLAAFRHRDPRVRSHAARAMLFRASREARIINAFMELTADEEATVRASAFIALKKALVAGKRHDETDARIGAAARRALATDPHEEVRRAAALNLGYRYTERDKNAKALTGALGDRSARVRQNAAEMLCRRPARDAVGPLMGLLQDIDPNVRKYAVLALGAAKAREAVPAICRLLYDKDGLVRESAASALGAIGDESAIDPLIDALEAVRPAPSKKAIRASLKRLSGVEKSFPFRDLKAWRDWQKRRAAATPKSSP